MSKRNCTHQNQTSTNCAKEILRIEWKCKRETKRLAKVRREISANAPIIDHEERIREHERLIDILAQEIARLNTVVGTTEARALEDSG